MVFIWREDNLRAGLSWTIVLGMSRYHIDAVIASNSRCAYNIVQEYDDPVANWIHAVLHKIEGDQGNSCYWYAKTDGKRFEDFDDATLELKEMLNQLS